MSVTDDIYLASLLLKYDVTRGGSFVPERDILAPIRRSLHECFTPARLPDIKLSGSHAKGTAVLGGTDVDVFLSFAEQAGTLAEIYEEVFRYATACGWTPSRQNVSIRIKYTGFFVDLVPARRQPKKPGCHSLLKRRDDTWVQTNVEMHIQRVRDTGLSQVLRLVKIWRNHWELDFPSFILELAAMRCLATGRPVGMTAQFRAVMRCFAETIETVRLVDPANTNNILSEDLRPIQTREIATTAHRSATMPLREIIQ